MGYFVSSKAWRRYENIVNKFINNDAGKQPFVWLEKVPLMSEWGEDSDETYVKHDLEGLFHYNYIKTWPSNNQQNYISGELDATDCVLYISADLLRSRGFLDEYGYWRFNWAEDRFILNGHVYQPSGDTQVAQSNDKALFFFIILQRMSPEESKSILDQYKAGKCNCNRC